MWHLQELLAQCLGHLGHDYVMLSALGKMGVGNVISEAALAPWERGNLSCLSALGQIRVDVSSVFEVC